MATPSKNTKAYLLGNAEFSFSEGATSPSDARTKGYLDFGNIVAFTPNIELSRQDHFSSYRGLRRRDKSVVTQEELTYQLRSDQWDKNMLKQLLAGKDASAFTQSSQSGATSDTFKFSSTASQKDQWYDIMVSGARIRNLTSVSFTGLTEGTDYEVDTKLGRVRFMTQQNSDITATIDAPAINSGDAKSFLGITPLQEPRKSGYGRIIIFDQNNNNKKVIDHVDFSCDIIPESAGEVAGENYSEITLNVNVTDDVGKFLVREANTFS